jgi:RimJ/RimL family protein N-acetyltransferase
VNPPTERTRPPLPTLPLGTPGGALRAWRPADAPALAAQADDPAVWRNMSEGFPHPYTPDLARHWVDRGHIDFGGDNWAITLDDAVVGGCGIHAGSGGLRCNAEIGYWIGQAHWGRGLGTQVVRALAERAFADPAITRVYAPVHAYNPASLRVLAKNGFVQEALLRLSALKAGTLIDRVLMARYRPGLEGGMPALPTLEA